MPKNAETLTATDIEVFFRKLKATLAAAERGLRLQDFISEFDGVPARAKAAKARPAPAPRKGKAAPAKKTRRRARQPGLSTDKVLAGLKGAKDGLSLADLAKKLGEKNKDRVAAALRKLRDEKKAVVEGDRRTAKWLAA